HAFQEDRPIAARPVGRLAHAWRWCKRNRAVAALLAAVLVVLSAGVVVSTALGLRARASARLADRKAEEADASARRAEQGDPAALETPYATGISLAHREWQVSNPYRARQLLDACPAEQRGWEWRYLDGLFRGDLVSLRGHQGIVRDLAVSPRGDRVVT